MRPGAPAAAAMPCAEPSAAGAGPKGCEVGKVAAEAATAAVGSCSAAAGSCSEAVSRRLSSSTDAVFVCERSHDSITHDAMDKCQQKCKEQAPVKMQPRRRESGGMRSTSAFPKVIHELYTTHITSNSRYTRISASHVGRNERTGTTSSNPELPLSVPEPLPRSSSKGGSGEALRWGARAGCTSSIPCRVSKRFSEAHLPTP